MPFDDLSRYRMRATGTLVALTTILCFLTSARPIQIARQQTNAPSVLPELVLQVGHPGKINAVAFSPDGNTLASGGEDRTVKLWDIHTGELKRTLVGHVAEVGTIVFSRDGKTLASDGGKDVGCGTGDGAPGETILWDTQSWTVKRKLGNSQFKFFSIAFSSNIRTVAFSSDDTQIWDAVTGKLRWKVRSAGVVACSPDGQTVALAGWDGSVQLRDARTGAVRRTLSASTGEPIAVVFSPDGRTLALRSGGTLTVWNTKTGVTNQTLSIDGGILFSPDGKSLASWTNPEDGSLTLNIWDCRTWRVKHTLNRPDLHATSVAFSPDARMLGIACTDGTIRLFTIRTGTVRMLTSRGASLDVSRLIGEGNRRPFAMSPDGFSAAMASGDRLSLWDLRTGELKQSFKGHRGFVLSVAFSPHGNVIASGGDDNTVRLWDLENGKLRRVLSGSNESGHFTSLAFFPDDKTVTANGLFWDSVTGARKTSPNAEIVGPLAFSPNGKSIAAFGSGEILLIEILTGKTRKIASELGEGVIQVAFSPDGSLIAAAQSCGQVTLWNAHTGVVRKSVALLDQFEDVLSVVFSPDGKTGAGGCSDNSVRLFDVQTGKLKRTLIGHSNDVIWVAFSPDGKTLASGSSDNTLKIWESNSGRLLATMMVLPSKKGEATEWIAFTPEGYYIGSTGAARFIRWRVGDQLAPAASYEATFHRPDLIEKSLKGEQ